MPKFNPTKIKLDSIHVMTNPDKQWHEAWGKPKNRSIACLPHPFTLCLLGVKNRGKTNTICNIFLQHQISESPFQRLIVVGPSNMTAKSCEYSEMQPTAVLTDIPDLKYFGTNKIKTLLVFDDFDLSKLNNIQKRNLSELFRCNTHVGLSLAISYQSFTDVPVLIRNVASQFVLWKTHNKNETSGVARKVGLSKNQLHYILDTYLTGHYDNLMIDLSKDTPAFLRKNIFEKIDVPEF